ncbi:MAG: OadG family protein [Pseudobutyrivibrio sp.]|nr:OadG family protein [Pseudobutyrivibrio sp.]
MRKKLLLILMTFTLSLSLFACGSSKEDNLYGGYDEAYYENLSRFYIYYALAFTDDPNADLDAAGQYLVKNGVGALQVSAVQNGLPEYLDESFICFDGLLNSLSECKEEDLGEYKDIIKAEPTFWDKKFPKLTGYDPNSTNYVQVVKSGKTITATTILDYENRDVKVTFAFKSYNVDGGPTSIEASPIYTKGEIMKKAGLNTGMGIGIVFFMLVAMSLIIKSFEIIPIIEKKFKKKNDEVKPVSPVVATNKVATKDETDNLELVAVIAAAIAASTGTSTDSFVVRSIKRR